MKCKSEARKTCVTSRKIYHNPSDPNSYVSCLASAKASADASLQPILELQEKNILAVIEATEWKASKLVAASYYNYTTTTIPTGFVYPDKTKIINLASPSLSFTPANVSGNSITKDSRYEDEITFKIENGNTAEVTKKDGVTKSYLWDFDNNYPVAEAVNATNDKIAYTSFEADSKGNWAFSGNPVPDNFAVTGSKVYDPTNGPITRSVITAGNYIVSYWSKNGQRSVNSIAGNSGRSINDWTYYEHKLALSDNATVIVSGSGVIDELRLYPEKTLMTTYTYIPLFGVFSQCDPNNRINYYTYDILGRLSLIKDQDQNILRKIDYKYHVANQQ